MAENDDPSLWERARERAAELRASISTALGRDAPQAAPPSPSVPAERAAAQGPASSMSPELVAQATSIAADGVQPQPDAAPAAPRGLPGTVNRYGKEVLESKAQEGHAIGRDQAAEQRNGTANPRIERPQPAPSAAPPVADPAKTPPQQAPSPAPAAAAPQSLDANRARIIEQIRERYPSPPDNSGKQSPGRGRGR